MVLKHWTPFPYLDAEWRLDAPERTRDAVDFHPSIDVVRGEGEIVLMAELPGLTTEDVELSFDRGILTIKGEKLDEKKADKGNRFIRERIFGTFQRRIALPDGVTPDGIDATFENGVLTVRIPVPEGQTSEPKRIPVSTKGNS